MDKKELRSVISSFVVGNEIIMTFRGDLAKLNGSYKVLNVKKGKGKGGSLLSELSPVNGGDSIVVGTPDSENVLNVTVNGTLHGYETEEDVPLVIKPDAGRASEIKEILRGCTAGVSSLTMVSELLPEFNGEFTVVSVKPSKGRYGQVIATLKNQNGSVELWSYRHSGAIKEIVKV